MLRATSESKAIVSTSTRGLAREGIQVSKLILDYTRKQSMLFRRGELCGSHAM
jgi:hypothetical protein